VRALVPANPERRRLRDRLRRRSRSGVFALPGHLAAETTALCRVPHRLTPGNQVTLLQNGDEAFPAMLEAIRGAGRSVRIESYIFQDGTVGRAFGDALCERARAGVEVQVIYDAVGSLRTAGEFWARLREAGAQVHEFHPLSLLRRLMRFQRRDHRKLLVVDSRVAFAGGMNISDSYLTTEVSPGWRDTHVRVAGPVVPDLERLFVSTWQYVTGRAIRLPAPPPPPVGGQLVAAIGSTLRRHRKEIYRAYLHAIRNARRSIRIANAYFIPPRGARRALRNAAQRGVQVEVIVPEWGDLVTAHFASRRLFDRLLRDGVRLFLWPDAVMHAKTAVIDGVWSTVGSFNLDQRSIFHNIEVNLNVVDPDFGARMEEHFVADRERCREVSLFDWRLRALGERFLERLCYLFRYWL
jgi:cardiolipin synthase